MLDQGKSKHDGCKTNVSLYQYKDTEVKRIIICVLAYSAQQPLFTIAQAADTN